MLHRNKPLDTVTFSIKSTHMMSPALASIITPHAVRVILITSTVLPPTFVRLSCAISLRVEMSDSYADLRLPEASFGLKTAQNLVPALASTSEMDPELSWWGCVNVPA